MYSACERNYNKVIVRTDLRNRYPWLKANCCGINIRKGIRQSRFVTLEEGLTLLLL